MFSTLSLFVFHMCVCVCPHQRVYGELYIVLLPISMVIHFVIFFLHWQTKAPHTVQDEYQSQRVLPNGCKMFTFHQYDDKHTRKSASLLSWCMWSHPILMHQPPLYLVYDDACETYGTKSKQHKYSDTHSIHTCIHPYLYMYNICSQKTETAA